MRRERDQLVEANNSVNNFSFPEWMPNIADEFTVNYKFEISDGFPRFTCMASEEGKLKTSWQEIFKKIGNEIYEGISIHYLSSTISDTILLDITNSYIRKNLVEEERYRIKTSVDISYEKIRDTLLGYNIVETKTRHSEGGRDYISFEISNSGKKYLSFLNVGKTT